MPRPVYALLGRVMPNLEWITRVVSRNTGMARDCPVSSTFAVLDWFAHALCIS
jgi:hypothetical protein